MDKSKSQPKFSNYTVTQGGPKIKDPEVAKLLPSVHTHVMVSVDLINVNIGIANAIRRMVSGSIGVWCMDFEPGALKTNDEFVLVDMLRRRINLIPITQTIDPGVVFSVNTANTTEALVSIKSSSIVPNKGKSAKYFNETFDLVDLHPSKSLTIDKITLIKGVGSDDARHTAAFRVCLLPLDQTPINPYTGVGVPSSLSDPRSHRLSFSTNGNIDPKQVLDSALVELLSMVERGRKAISSVQTQQLQSSVSFENSNDTLGNMLLKTGYDIYPNGVDLRYNVDELSGKITLELRSPDDPAVVIGSIFSELRVTFEKLRSQIKSL